MLSEHEQRLLLTGTLDTTGVAPGPYDGLGGVSVAFGGGREPVVEAERPEEGPSEPTPKQPEQPVTSRKRGRRPAGNGES